MLYSKVAILGQAGALLQLSNSVVYSHLLTGWSFSRLSGVNDVYILPLLHVALVDWKLFFFPVMECVVSLHLF